MKLTPEGVVQHILISNLSCNDFPMNSPITEDKTDNLLFSSNEIQNAKKGNSSLLELSNENCSLNLSKVCLPDRF